MIIRLIRFLKHDLWHIERKDKATWKWLLIKYLRVVILSIQGFNEDKVQLRASALTYYTVFSIVPILALLFAIAKGFGFEKPLQEELLQQNPNNNEVLTKVFDFANNMLENTQGGLMAFVGVILLIWSVIKVLGNVEESFNDIWQIRSGRSWVRKFTDYFAIFLVAPLLLVVSSSATIFIQTHLEEIATNFGIYDAIGPLMEFGFQLIPYVLIWFVFALLYIVMPNTTVQIKSAIIAGIVAGSAFELFQLLYIYFQVGVTRYNAIYGSFAALPLFLIWLHTSWLIILAGAELAFSFQNIDSYESERKLSDLSIESFYKVSLVVVNKIAQNFASGSTQNSLGMLSQQTSLPIRVIQSVCDDLVESKVLQSINSSDQLQERVYNPAFDIHTITVGKLLSMINAKGKSFDLKNATTNQELDELVQLNYTQSGKLLVMDLFKS